MSFRFFYFIPLCLILCGCGSSSADELSLEEAESICSEDPESLSEEPSDISSEVKPDGQTDSGNIYVYACGKVKTPGVYMVPAGSRIFEVLALAGGPLDEADISAVNQAEICYDGEMIYIPAEGELDDPPEGIADADEKADDGRININTADSTELQQLKGIGASRAEDIISYRENNGNFPDPESIMKVPGIKQGTFDKIKDRIKVS
ncbi:MAG: helix-hairpin-helix domain-containing protein [Lachnospiraceae bacterium]|nr:helix-hairpin-helix domain-containing protein [Lachnospiraceae bacterium]